MKIIANIRSNRRLAKKASKANKGIFAYPVGNQHYCIVENGTVYRMQHRRAARPIHWSQIVLW